MENDQDETAALGSQVTPPQASKQAAPATSFARFLYTQNPFYLISCALVIYGLQSLAVSRGDLLTKSFAMSGGIALYALLMAAICIAVVRIAKVWDDARSIFLVVIICLVALSTGFDELCISDNDMSWGFAGLAGILTIGMIEAVVGACRIRLTLWYRVSLYGLFAVFIGFPVLLGRAVAERNDLVANWGSVFFSTAIAGCLLMLIPAVRRGPASASDSGTPWRWPLYPLAAFFVIAVLAGIRAHAIWISFGFYGVAGKFEPFLLLPILSAIVLLVAEYGLGQKRLIAQYGAVIAAPLLLLCGMTNHMMTWLPIRSELQYYAGSGWTAALACVSMLYIVMMIRRVKFAAYGIPALLLLASASAPLPSFAIEFGLQPWMLAVVAAVITFLITLRHWDQDWFWAALAGSVTATIAITGQNYGFAQTGLVAASVFATASMLVIGAVFPTPLAEALRYLASITLIVAAVFCLFRFSESSASITSQPWPWLLAIVAVVSLVYARIVRRSAWLYLSAVQTLVFLVMISWSSYRAGQLRQINWPISSGLACLAVGLAITTGKTGFYQKVGEMRSKTSSRRLYESGF